MTRIRTAVFPVAGRGTRFLPATKASPKEMLPIVDKPLIQYAAEEALIAGAEKLVFVTGSSKRAIEDHFDPDYELERELESKGRNQTLNTLRGIVSRADPEAFVVISPSNEVLGEGFKPLTRVRTRATR